METHTHTHMAHEAFGSHLCLHQSSCGLSLPAIEKVEKSWVADPFSFTFNGIPLGAAERGLINPHYMCVIITHDDVASLCECVGGFFQCK